MSELIDNAKARRGVLKHLILQLHDGQAPDAVKPQLMSLLGRVPYSEVVEVEQELISEGLPAEEILRLCDLHSAALKGALDTSSAKTAPPCSGNCPVPALSLPTSLSQPRRLSRRLILLLRSHSLSPLFFSPLLLCSFCLSLLSSSLFQRGRVGVFGAFPGNRRFGYSVEVRAAHPPPRCDPADKPPRPFTTGAS